MPHEFYLAEITHGETVYSKIGISRCSKCRLIQHTTKGKMKGSTGRLVLVYELPEYFHAQLLENACKGSLADQFDCLRGDEWYKAPLADVQAVVERIKGKLDRAGTFQ